MLSKRPWSERRLVIEPRRVAALAFLAGMFVGAALTTVVVFWSLS